MAEFPKTFKSKSFVTGDGPGGEKIVKMVLEDGTVLGPDAEPISGPGFEAKKAAPKKSSSRAPVKKIGATNAAKAAARLESEEPPDEEGF